MRSISNHIPAGLLVLVAASSCGPPAPAAAPTTVEIGAAKAEDPPSVEAEPPSKPAVKQARDPAPVAPALLGPAAPGPGPLGPFMRAPPALTAPGPGASPAQPIPEVDAESLRPRLTERVAAEGGGMQLDAGPMAGRFQQGDAFELPFTLAPGKCYMAVAISSGGIGELDLEIAATLPNMPPMVLAVDNTKGSDATLGGAPNCFKNPLPIAGPVLLRVRATKGAGLAAAQVLSR